MQFLKKAKFLVNHALSGGAVKDALARITA